MADVRIERDLRIPMRDGIHLAANVIRSDRPDIPLRAWLADVAPGGFSTRRTP